MRWSSWLGVWVVDNIVTATTTTIRLLPARRLYTIEAVTPAGLVSDTRFGVWIDGP